MISKRREIQEKIYEEDTRKLFRLFNEGWSFALSARKACMPYEYAMFLRKRNPEFNEYIVNRNQNKPKAPK